MGFIVNTNTLDEYNQKVEQYQMNGFKIEYSSRNNYQTRLTKKNFGPVIVHVLLLVSLIGFIVFESELVLYALSISDIFIPLNFFSLIVAVKYLQDIGIILLIIFIIMLLIVVYYYFTQPYEVVIRLNSQNSNINNFNNFNPNGGNNYVG